MKYENDLSRRSESISARWMGSFSISSHAQYSIRLGGDGSIDGGAADSGDGTTSNDSPDMTGSNLEEENNQEGVTQDTNEEVTPELVETSDSETTEGDDNTEIEGETGITTGSLAEVFAKAATASVVGLPEGEEKQSLPPQEFEKWEKTPSGTSEDFEFYEADAKEKEDQSPSPPEAPAALFGTVDLPGLDSLPETMTCPEAPMEACGGYPKLIDADASSGFELATAGNEYKWIGGDKALVVRGDRRSITGGQVVDHINGPQLVQVGGHAEHNYYDGRTTWINGDEEIRITGDITGKVEGKNKLTIEGDVEHIFRMDRTSITAGNKFSIHGGTTESVHIGGKADLFLGGKFSVNASIEASRTYGRQYKWVYAKEIKKGADKEEYRDDVLLRANSYRLDATKGAGEIHLKNGPWRMDMDLDRGLSLFHAEAGKEPGLDEFVLPPLPEDAKGIDMTLVTAGEEPRYTTPTKKKRELSLHPDYVCLQYDDDSALALCKNEIGLKVQKTILVISDSEIKAAGKKIDCNKGVLKIK